MSARDALPTGLALGAHHLPSGGVLRAIGVLTVATVLDLLRYRHSRDP